MITNKYLLISAIVVGIFTSSCTKESANVGSNQSDKNTTQIEGVIKDATWIAENVNLPSDEMKSIYKKIEISVDQDLNYSWKWVKLNGEVIEMTGYMYEEKSQYKHETGSSIWNVYVYVTKINGQDLAGGFYGVYSYQDENHLLLNVEPDMRNWGIHPKAEAGLGSGQNGNESVYVLTKQ